jgi:two-component system chemotaxis response regulator CheB
MVVDDSALMRRLISDLLESDDGIEVVGTARDGQEAVEKVATLRPDVITLDVEMPRLNGLEALSQIMQQFPTPVVMLTGLGDADVALEAMERGAVEFVVKPSGTISVDLYKIREELIRKVRLARLANLRKLTRLPAPASVIPPPVPAAGRKRSEQHAVIIAASTGGPRAVEHVLAALPGDLPATVLVVQHMPAGFTRSFAQRLDQRSALRVQEAEEGDRVTAGHAFVAPGGYHMRVRPGSRNSGSILSSSKGSIVRLDDSAPIGGLRPAADITMIDVAEVYGIGSVGVVLTGMGSDGARGIQQIKAAGGVVIAQDQETSVVYGMPRAAARTGVVDQVLPLSDIPAAIVRAVTRRLESAS